MDKKKVDLWTAKRALKPMRWTLEDRAEEAQTLKELTKALKKKDELSLGRVTHTFDQAGAWVTVRGVFAIEGGDWGGWELIQRGFRRGALHYIACFQEHQALKARGIQREHGYGWPFTLADLSDICLTLLHAIATHEDECATFLGDRLVGYLEQPDDLFFPQVFELTPFESFAVLLYCRWKGIRRKAVEKFLSTPKRFSFLHSDAYREVIKSWSSEESFERAVPGMVDLRSRWTGHEYEPWAFYPYQLVPIEFLALRRIRQEQGLPFRMPEHPMLQTPWAALPEGLDRVRDDELWHQVVRRCRQLFPELVLPKNWEG
jgi:hypothetical protein